jgi:histone deacetylase complex regulatory component SIN3
MGFHPNAPNAHSIGMATQQAPYHSSGPVESSMTAPLGMMSLAGASSPNVYPPAGSSHDPGMQHPRVDPGLDQQIEFHRAINYVNKIKMRFSGDPETYKTFLELLQRHREGSSDVNFLLSLFACPD